MTTLPAPERRAHVRAFTLIVAFGAALLGAAIAAAAPAAAAVCACAVAALAAAGWRRPDAAARLYRLWNRAAGAYARVARTWVTLLCYGIVGTAALARSRMPWAPPRPPRSGWAPAPRAAAPEPASPAVREPTRHWVREYRASSRHADTRWLRPLLPYLVLLGAIDSGRSGRGAGPNVYTLY